MVNERKKQTRIRVCLTCGERMRRVIGSSRAFEELNIASSGGSCDACDGPVTQARFFKAPGNDVFDMPGLRLVLAGKS